MVLIIIKGVALDVLRCTCSVKISSLLVTCMYSVPIQSIQSCKQVWSQHWSVIVHFSLLSLMILYSKKWSQLNHLRYRPQSFDQVYGTISKMGRDWCILLSIVPMFWCEVVPTVMCVCCVPWQWASTSWDLSFAIPVVTKQLALKRLRSTSQATTCASWDKWHIFCYNYFILPQ